MRIFEKGNNGGSGGDDNDDDDSILKSDRNAGTFLSGAQRLDQASDDVQDADGWGGVEEMD